MSMRVVIAGGGIIGAALALRLLEGGARVVIVDSGAPTATAAAAGMLAPSFEHAADHAGPDLYEFGRASLERWRNFAPALERDSGVWIDYRNDGVLGVAFDCAQRMHLAAACEGLLERGAPVAFLSGAEARAAAPGLSADISGALLALEDGQVDPRRTMAALRRVIELRGGAFLAAPVIGLSVRNGAAGGVLIEGGEVVEADAVVIAAGAAASMINTGALKPPVYPVKGEAVSLAMAKQALNVVIRAPGAYLCPKADGRLVVGATEVADDESLEPSAAAIDTLKQNAARAFPAASAYPETERWAGLRPATPDAAPILGCDPRGPEGLYFALGHYRNGILLAPQSAEILRRRILDGEDDPFLAAFRPDRFS